MDHHHHLATLSNGSVERVLLLTLMKVQSIMTSKSMHDDDFSSGVRLSDKSGWVAIGEGLLDETNNQGVSRVSWTWVTMISSISNIGMSRF